MEWNRRIILFEKTYNKFMIKDTLISNWWYCSMYHYEEIKSQHLKVSFCEPADLLGRTFSGKYNVSEFLVIKEGKYMNRVLHLDYFKVVK